MKKPLIALIPLIALVAGAVALVKLRQARNAAEPLPIIPPVTVATRTLTLEEVILTRPAVAESRRGPSSRNSTRWPGYAASRVRTKTKSPSWRRSSSTPRVSTTPCSM
jgi:hypothetical protein